MYNTSIMTDDEIENMRNYSRIFVRELGFFRKGITRMDLSLAQGHILVEINRRNNLTQQELAETLRIDQSSASRNLKLLIDRKFISLVRDEKDARRRFLRLTEAGKSALRRYNTNARSDVERAFSFLEKQEIRTCIEGMRMYSEAWKKANEKKEHS
jgi:DNA-binding MarR family transcriptional regulator